MMHRFLTIVALFSGLGLGVVPLHAQQGSLPPVSEILEEADPLTEVEATEITGFHFIANTVFTNEELGEVVETYLDKPMTRQDLEVARNELTRFYVEHGYINSGVVLEDPPIVDGVVTFRIVEGVLSDIRLTGNDWLADYYLTHRIRLGAGTPLNVLQLKNQLELLRENPNIKTIKAELHPGPVPGDSLLDVAVEEANALHLGLRFDNARSPSIGAERFSLLVSHTNLTGHSDQISLDYGITKNGIDEIELSGKDNIAVSYALPFTAYDTTFGASYSRTDSLVVEEPFVPLDITSELREVKLSLRQPLYRTLGTEIAITVAGERRENQTFLSGAPFSFSQGAQNGESDVSVLRIDQEFSTRDQQQAIALLSTFRIGLDVLDPTIGDPVDGEFFSWLGQFQYILRLGETNNQLLFRVSAQQADRGLLSLEQFALGGVDTVRGYRQNQVVRDNGIALSGELRFPLIFDANGRAILSAVPFVDFGYGWDEGQDSNSINIASTGIGLLLNLNNKLNGYFYWGYPFRDFDDPEDDIQDLGIHFSITWFPF